MEPSPSKKPLQKYFFKFSGIIFSIFDGEVDTSLKLVKTM